MTDNKFAEQQIFVISTVDTACIKIHYVNNQTI